MKRDQRSHDLPAPASRSDAASAADQIARALPGLSGLTRTLLDSMTEGVSISAEDGTIVYTNPAEDRIFGYTPGELIGQHVSVQNAYPPDENARIVAEVIAELRRSGSWRGEWLNRRKNGSVFVTTSRISSVEIEGRPHWLCVQEDVTAEKSAAAALRESEARLELAAAAAGAGVWDWDVPTGRLVWSPEIYAFYGVDRKLAGDRLFQAWVDAIHPEDRDWANETAQRAAREGESFSMDFRVFRPDGELRWIRSQGTVVLDAEGRATRVVGINIDVTEQHRQEEHLRAEAERLELTVEERTRERDRFYELSNDLFAVAGFDGYLKTINPAWERLLGYNQEDLLARPFAELIHPEDLAPATEVIAALRSGETVQRFEDRLICADGEPVWIAWAAVPHGDFFYAVGRNVTRDKEREDALRQAQKMEAIGQLTGGIAHDFNNLLQGVVGTLDLIRRKPHDAARVARWAEAGLTAADRGTKLTSQLLAFSRAQKIELKPVMAADLVAGFRELLARTLGPSIQLTLDLDSVRLPVLGDPTQLEMALLNLAINARDAMPDGGRLTIATRLVRIGRDPELEPGDYIELSVTDTGTGMAPDVAAKAFDPFFTTKAVGKGTGLGLSQVYGIARQAGGTARIESRPGKGTTVRLYLPGTAALTQADAASTSVTSAQTAPAATVLIVDDDPDVRQFLLDSLDALGYRAEEAEDGYAALQALERLTPDLIILDFAMPGLNGADVAREVRSISPELPIVFATGYADMSAIERAVGRDATVLRKPFLVDELQAVLAAALQRSR